MRLKVFITTFLLFVVLFFLSLSVISLYLLQHQLNTMKQKSMAEHYFISASLGKDLQALQSRDEHLDDVFEELLVLYGVYFVQSSVYMSIEHKGTPIFSNVPFQMETEALFLDEQTRILSVVSEGERKYIKISGVIPYVQEDYILHYWYDFSHIFLSWQQFKAVLLWIGFLFSVILAFFLQVFLKKVFKPLNLIHQASGRIAQGDYENRLEIEGTDEISEVAAAFNHMAAEIQNKIQVLSETNRQSQQLIDNLSHDIRTPLTSIYGYAEYMAKAHITEEDKIQMNHIIMEESTHILNTANILLKMAAYRNNLVEKDTLQVTALFMQVKNMMQLKLKKKEIRLVTEGSFDTLEGNKDLLVNMLVNLLDNAIQASYPGGEILCCAYKENGRKIIAVKDQGIGMAESHIKRIEEPFYRVDTARNRKNGGAGLGLSIVRQIALCHDACMEIESSDGRGTTVKIIFTALQ